jgi:hypothetical protein
MYLKTLRALDGILFSLFAILVISIHPGLGKNTFGQFHLICCLPFLTLAWFVFQLPGSFDNTTRWRTYTMRARISAVIAAGLSPFIMWWSAYQNSIYLSVNFVIAMIAFISIILNLNMLLHELAAHNSNQILEYETRMNRFFIIYFLLIPFIALSKIALINLILTQTYSHSLMDFIDSVQAMSSLASNVLMIIKYVTLIPILFLFSLLFRSRFALTKHYEALNMDSA